MERKTMRFKKGSEVEVFHSSKILPAGFWRPAVILRGNGRTYTVQYNQQCCSSSPNNNINEERVPRQALRPPPPIKEKAGKWVPGELVEVFVHGFWKLAKVTGAAYGNEYYFVSLFGQYREVAVKKTNLRKRLAWENGKWSTKKETGMEMGMKKRKLLEVGTDNSNKKCRVSGNVYANNSCENESTVSSTGSCSTGGRPYDYLVIEYCEDDSASSFVPIQMPGLTSTKSTDTDKHTLELDAYHSTMVALYANGSISWEQETMLSNLRLLLNISYDEHQSVLRSVAPSR